MKLYSTSVIRHAENQAGGFVIFDTEQDKVLFQEEQLKPSLTVYSEDNPRGGSRGNRGLCFLPNGNIAIASSSGIHIYDKSDLKEINTITHPSFSSLHNLQYWEGRLYVTLTGVDAYATVDLQTMAVKVFPVVEIEGIDKIDYLLKWRERELKPFPHDQDRRPFIGGDMVHLNYIKAYPNEVVALFCGINTAVRLKPHFEILWAPKSPEQIHTAKRGSNTLNAPHDIVRYENGYLINSSATQELQFLNQEGHIKTVFALPSGDNWNRGLAIDQDQAFVGTGNGNVYRINIKSGELIQKHQIFPDPALGQLPYQHAIFGLEMRR